MSKRRLHDTVAAAGRTRLHLAELSLACQHAERLTDLAEKMFSAHPQAGKDR